MSKRRKTGKPGISKAAAYQHGIFTIPYDLRGIVELLGLERTIEVATAIQQDIDKSKRSKNKIVRKIASTADRALQTQLSETVARSLAHIQATKRANRAKRAA